MGRVNRIAAALLTLALIAGACTEEPVEVELGPRLPVGDPAEPKELPNRLLNGGEWIGERVVDNGRLQAIGVHDDDVVVLIDGRSSSDGQFRLYTMSNGRPTPISEWITHPEAPAAAQQWRSVVAIDAIDGPIVVGARSGASAPISAVLEGAEPVFSAVASVAGRASVGEAVSDGKSIVAIGSVDRSPAVWRSTDGLHWRRVPLPSVFPSGGLVTDVAHAAGLLLIAGHSTGGPHEPMVLTSRDGVDWDAHVLAEPDVVGNVNMKGVGHDGSSFVAVGLAGYEDNGLRRDVTWTSLDGLAWSNPVGPDAAAFGDGRLTIPHSASHTATSSATMLITGASEYRADLMYCYDDVATCRVHYRAMWTADAGTWRRLSVPADLDVTAAAVVGDTLYAGGRIDRTIGLYEWRPAEDGRLPVVESFDPAPPVTELPEPWDREVEPGVVYAETVHRDVCEQFNGRWWIAERVTADAFDVIRESGAWRASEIYGTVELIAEDRIEYAIPGHGPIAYLRPAEGQPDRCISL